MLSYLSGFRGLAGQSGFFDASSDLNLTKLTLLIEYPFSYRAYAFVFSFIMIIIVFFLY